MSFYAYTDKSHSEKSMVKASDVTAPEERSADYYCPGCNCIFRYRSIASNGRAAHFCKQRGMEHAANCWMPDFSDKDEPKEFKEYDWDGFSAQEFLNTIQTAANRTGSVPNYSPSAGSTGTVHKIKATTVRELFRICCENPVTTRFPDGNTVLDILCSRKTAYFYKYFCRGIKLIEARYHEKRGNHIFFTYPYSSDENQVPTFIVRIYIKNKKMYDKILKTVRGSSRPILLFANWKCHRDEENGIEIVYTEILNEHQVVPLS